MSVYFQINQPSLSAPQHEFSFLTQCNPFLAFCFPSFTRCHAPILVFRFHIDYSSRGIEFDLPPEAFGSSWHDASTTQVGNDKSTDTNSKSKRGLSIQSLFINSSQFAGYEKLYGATKRLAQRVEANIISDNKYRKDTSTTHQEMVGAEMHVIPGTSHQNFCDTIFWLPRRLAKRVFFLGDTDAYEAYESILNKTIQFLERF